MFRGDVAAAPTMFPSFHVGFSDCADCRGVRSGPLPDQSSMRRGRAWGSFEADGNDLRPPFELLPGDEAFRQVRYGLTVPEPFVRRGDVVQLPDLVALHEIGSESRVMRDQPIADLSDGPRAAVQESNEQRGVRI